MGIYALCVEGVVNDFGVSLVDLLRVMEVIEILGDLELEGINDELEKLETYLMWFQGHNQK